MKEFKIGTEIKVRNPFSKLVNKIGVIVQINDTSFTYPILVKFNDIDHNIPFTLDELEIIDGINYKSINAVEHDNGSIIKWKNIDRLNLKVNIDGRVNITTLCKILLNYIDELDNFTYKRVCPYKLIHEYARDRNDKTHLFYIKYLTIQGEIRNQSIIQTDHSMSIIKGEYNFFIPDLLEVAKDRGLVELTEDTYICKKKKISNIASFCKELKVIDRHVLESEGWTVPSQFEKYFNITTINKI